MKLLKVQPKIYVLVLRAKSVQHPHPEFLSECLRVKLQAKKVNINNIQDFCILVFVRLVQRLEIIT